MELRIGLLKSCLLAVKEWIINIKLFKYRTAGVREYWIVDPIREMILVYDFENDDYEQYSFSEIVKVRIYDDFEINFTTI